MHVYCSHYVCEWTVTKQYFVNRNDGFEGDTGGLTLEKLSTMSISSSAKICFPSTWSSSWPQSSTCRQLLRTWSIEQRDGGEVRTRYVVHWLLGYWISGFWVLDYWISGFWITDNWISGFWFLDYWIYWISGFWFLDYWITEFLVSGFWITGYWISGFWFLDYWITEFLVSGFWFLDFWFLDFWLRPVYWFPGGPCGLSWVELSTSCDGLQG
jgi:hypothetical protein